MQGLYIDANTFIIRGATWKGLKGKSKSSVARIYIFSCLRPLCFFRARIDLLVFSYLNSFMPNAAKNSQIVLGLIHYMYSV